MKAALGIEERLLKSICFGGTRKYVWMTHINFYSIISEAFNRKKNISRALARKVR